MNPTTIRMALKMGRKAVETFKDRRDEKAGEFYDELDQLKKKAVAKRDEIKEGSSALADKAESAAHSAGEKARKAESEGTRKAAQAVKDAGKKKKKCCGCAKRKARKAAKAAKKSSAAAAVTAAAARAKNLDTKKIGSAVAEAEKKADSATKAARKKAATSLTGNNAGKSGGIVKFVSILAVLVGIGVSAWWWVTRKESKDTPSMPPRVRDHTPERAYSNSESTAPVSADRMKDAAAGAAAATADKVEDLRSKAQDLIEDLKADSGDLLDEATDKADELEDGAADKLDDFSETVDDLKDEAADTAGEVKDELSGKAGQAKHAATQAIDEVTGDNDDDEELDIEIITDDQVAAGTPLFAETEDAVDVEPDVASPAPVDAADLDDSPLDGNQEDLGSDIQHDAHDIIREWVDDNTNGQVTDRDDKKGPRHLKAEDQ